MSAGTLALLAAIGAFLTIGVVLVPGAAAVRRAPRLGTTAMIGADELRREPAADWIPFYCLSGHAHGTDRARRGCNAFGRAYARFERIDARYRGHALHEQQGAFDLWRCAGNLVNSLFTIAMSDVSEGSQR